MMLLPPISCPYTQDRRGHLKARKFGQCCNHISEFYSRLSQLSVCRHRDYRGLYFAVWVDLLLNENEFLLYSRQQSTAVNYYFVHWTKKASDCCQTYILQNFQKKIISIEISETGIFCKLSSRIRWYFLKFLWSKLSTGEIDINLVSFSIDFLQFLEWRAYSTTQFTTTSICHQRIVKISDKSHKWSICGVGTSKSRLNLYKFTI